MSNMKSLLSTRYVSEGDYVECLYPRHGSSNILAKRSGQVVAVGRGPQGRYITIQNGDVVRSLSESRIIKLRKLAK